MSDIAIQVENLSKSYRIGRRQEQHDTLRDQLAHSVRGILRRDNSADNQGRADTIWALKDVSFEVTKGEVVGIIGRNGAGKSTLLKVLSRITEPTQGRAILHGRVGSLLEVGTGFHLELTGRENIYLNGAILGMRREEIDRKFDEIVAFAEVEQFIDTPVKRYSSGMYVRLAFAVAAHLETEILLVDEVLAVGDAAFQKKCLGKIGDAAQHGRTILFVSHDMTNISVLCNSAVLLKAGRVEMVGPAKAVVSAYMSEAANENPSVSWSLDTAPGSEVARIVSLELRSSTGTASASYPISEPLAVDVTYHVGEGSYRLNPVLVVRNSEGITVFSTTNYASAEWGSYYYTKGVYKATCHVPGHLLNEGTYFVDLLLVHETRVVVARVESAITFSIYDDGKTRGGYVGPWVGVVRPDCAWTGERIGEPADVRVGR